MVIVPAASAPARARKALLRDSHDSAIFPEPHQQTRLEPPSHNPGRHVGDVKKGRYFPIPQRDDPHHPGGTQGEQFPAKPMTACARSSCSGNMMASSYFREAEAASTLAIMMK